MFRKIVTACAGVVLASSVALAVDVSGVYSASNNGKNLSLTLQEQDGMVRGMVAVDGANLPLVGREVNGQIQGIWQAPNGQNIPFSAAAGPDGLQFQTNGVTYSMTRGQAAGRPVVNAAAALAGPLGNGQAAQPAPAQQLQVETRRGRVMQCAVPAGWSFSESTNGVDVASPDGAIWMAHTFLRGCGRTNCDQYLQNQMKVWPQFGIANVQIIGTQDLGQKGKLYEMQFTHAGTPMHAMVQVSVRPAVESFMAETILIQAPVQMFEQCKPMLIELAKSVRVVDNGAFCDNRIIDGEVQKRANIRAKLASDIAQIQHEEYEYQSKMRDSMNLRASDTLRDNTRFDDGSGNQYVGPLQAQRMFKMPDGTVTYSPNGYDPAPPGSTELTPSRYGQ